jgi:NitT/TauT family transport system substrate-binding protein
MKLRSSIIAALIAATVGSSAQAEVSEIRITKQPGLLYSQLAIMESRKLIEKHAKAMGMPALKPKWIQLASGSAATDSLLSGSIDVVTSAVSLMLLLWSKTHGEVKGIVACAGTPLMLLSRNPAVNTVKDFSPTDRIAVPTIKVSAQSIILAIALEKAYPGDPAKYDSLVTSQIQLGHPDAALALLNPKHEVNAHFSMPPYQEMELKDPSVHVVLDSASKEALGDVADITTAFTIQKFHDANPTVMKIFIDAFDEASDIIKSDPRGAADSYLDVTKEDFKADDLAAIYADKRSLFKAAPVGTHTFADYMFKYGYITKKASSWKDYFFNDIFDRDGS